MSLDVYLTGAACEHCGRGGEELFTANVTHNLTQMADAAGIYQVMWRPEELGFTTAEQLVPLLTDGFEQLKAEPDRFRQLNSDNGWGTYEWLLDFVAAYLDACKQHPKATVSVWR